MLIPFFASLLENHKQLFKTSPGRTTVAHSEHFIPTTGNPVKIPPRRVPGNYHAEVQQINTMLQQGIIEPSSSPWMAPAVFVRKKNGEVRLCVLVSSSVCACFGMPALVRRKKHVKSLL